MKKHFDLRFLVLNFIFCSFYYLAATFAQTSPALTQKCLNAPPTERARVAVTERGDIELKPCPGRQVLVDGKLFNEGVVTDDSKNGEINAANFSTLAAAKTAAASAGKGLIVSTTIIVPASDVVNVPMRVVPGGKINVSAHATLQFQSVFSAPPIEIFNGAGKTDLSQAKIEEIYPDWFAPANTIDWSGAIVKASHSAASNLGSTVRFVCGKTYTVAAPVILDSVKAGFYNQNLKWKGCGSDYTDLVTLLYTGRGSASAFSFKSSYGLRLENVNIRYNNPNFTGALIDLSHSPTWGGDSAYYSISDSSLMGTDAAQGATLLVLDGSIIGRLEKIHFRQAAVGVRGMSFDSRLAAAGKLVGKYANVVTVRENTFTSVNVAINNPSSNWNIESNTFEPNASGKQFVLRNTCGDQCETAEAVTFKNNYIGDGASQTEPILDVFKASGWNIENNWVFYEAQSAAVFLRIRRGEAINVTGNHVQGVGALVFFHAETTFDTTIAGNKLNVGKYVGGDLSLASKLTVLQGRNGSVLPHFAAQEEVVSSQSAPIERPGVTLGYKSAFGGANSMGQIAVLDAALGVPNRSFGYFSPTDNSDSPHIFFTWNNSSHAEALRIAKSGIAAQTQITVPKTSAYDAQAWNDSAEVPTKDAVRDELEAVKATIKSSAAGAAEKFVLTDAAIVSINWKNSTVQEITLGGNRKLTFANPVAGASYLLILKQDGAGNRSVVFPTILWQNGKAPTLTATPRKTDLVHLVYDGANFYGKADLNF